MTLDKSWTFPGLELLPTHSPRPPAIFMRPAPSPAGVPSLLHGTHCGLALAAREAPHRLEERQRTKKFCSGVPMLISPEMPSLGGRKEGTWGRLLALLGRSMAGRSALVVGREAVTLLCPSGQPSPWVRERQGSQPHSPPQRVEPTLTLAQAHRPSVWARQGMAGSA